MGFFANLEGWIASVVEGGFSRVFRSEVRPVEIARKLAREMEQHQSESLSRIYVPNEYRVYLSRQDRERFDEYEDELATEFASYLLEYARRERFTLLSAPVIEFETDERLGLGRFGIETGVVHPQQVPAAERADAGQTMIHSNAARIASDLQEDAQARGLRAYVRYNGRTVVVDPGGATIGRSRDNEIVVEDPNVSRQHAELRPRGGAWVLSDLGSTNGSRLNGRSIAGPEVIQPGDEIGVGSTAITFELD